MYLLKLNLFFSIYVLKYMYLYIDKYYMFLLGIIVGKIKGK